MESQHTEGQPHVTNNPDASFTNLSSAPLRQVTPLSKYLAMALFVALPFIGGYIGWQYANMTSDAAAPVPIVNTSGEQLPATQIENNTPVFDTNIAPETLDENTNVELTRFEDVTAAISFQYPVSWGDIEVTIEDESWSCNDGSANCEKRHYAAQDGQFFLAVETDSTPMVGRGAYWGDEVSMIDANYEAICTNISDCTLLKNSNGVTFTKTANQHTCSDGVGCEGEGEYYTLFRNGIDYPKIVLGTYRLAETKKDIFEDSVIQSFSFIE